MAKFEKVSKYANSDIPMPVRKTAGSAGYDLVAAEDIVIPSYFAQMDKMASVLNPTVPKKDGSYPLMVLKDMKNLTKTSNAKPTLVSTGMKCKLEPGTYLELSVRSSSPLKYWLILANGVGIIDADYYNNSDNEGEIFLQLINFSLCDIYIPKGEAIGQGIIKSYLTTEDDAACGQRTGGFGSTNG